MSRRFYQDRFNLKLVIGTKELHRIKDIMLKLFRDQQHKEDIDLLRFKALESYLQSQGLQLDWTVIQDGRDE